MNNRQHIETQLKKMSTKQLEQELNVSNKFAERAVLNLMIYTHQKFYDIIFNGSLLSPEYYFQDYLSHMQDIELIKSEIKRRDIP
jgi:hypothetical protein